MPNPDAPPCAYCGDPDMAIDEIEPGKFALCCNTCGAIGPYASDAHEAIRRCKDRAIVAADGVPQPPQWALEIL